MPSRHDHRRGAAQERSCARQTGAGAWRRAHLVPNARPVVDRLGGGSHVQLDPLKVGPVSVGYRLLRKALPSAAGTTTTDVAIAAGVLTLGDSAKVAHLDAATCKRVFDEAARLVRGSDRPDEDGGGGRR